MDFFGQSTPNTGISSYDKNDIICVHSDVCEDGKFWNGSACVNPCDADQCGGAAHSVCIPKTHDTYICECDNADDGYFWSGSACVNPCDSHTCGSHSTGGCTPTSVNTFVCGCDDGYFWHETSCVNPCDSNPCAPLETCTPKAWNDYECSTHSCSSGYFWNGTDCIKSKNLGKLCTGQNKCYNNGNDPITCPSSSSADFFGQDAQYRSKCIAQSFTLGTDTQAGTVIDNNTGLEWQRKISSDTHVEETEADAYCEDLVYGGHDDWRLPEPNELLSIVNHNETAINTVYFPGLLNDPEILLLTSKYYANPEQEQERWKLYGAQMIIPSLMEVSDRTYRALCVRGNKMKGAKLSVSERNGDQIVRDSTTGLIWQKTSGTAVIWHDALSYCENLTYAGYSDWRLPNSNELASLVDYDRYNPASAFPFPDMEMSNLWSADTTAANDPQYTWLFWITAGEIYIFYKDPRSVYGESYNISVMCVRSE